MVVLATIALMVIVVSMLGSRVRSPLVSNLQGAVRFEVILPKTNRLLVCVRRRYRALTDPFIFTKELSLTTAMSQRPGSFRVMLRRNTPWT
jgi:hypothetical protein